MIPKKKKVSEFQPKNPKNPKQFNHHSKILEDLERVTKELEDLQLVASGLVARVTFNFKKEETEGLSAEKIEIIDEIDEIKKTLSCVICEITNEDEDGMSTTTQYPKEEQWEALEEAVAKIYNEVCGRTGVPEDSFKFDLEGSSIYTEQFLNNSKQFLNNLQSDLKGSLQFLNHDPVINSAYDSYSKRDLDIKSLTNDLKKIVEREQQAQQKEQQQAEEAAKAAKAAQQQAEEEAKAEAKAEVDNLLNDFRKEWSEELSSDDTSYLEKKFNFQNKKHINFILSKIPQEKQKLVEEYFNNNFKMITKVLNSTIDQVALNNTIDKVADFNRQKADFNRQDASSNKSEWLEYIESGPHTTDQNNDIIIKIEKSEILPENVPIILKWILVSDLKKGKIVKIMDKIRDDLSVGDIMKIDNWKIEESNFNQEAIKQIQYHIYERCKNELNQTDKSQQAELIPDSLILEYMKDRNHLESLKHILNTTLGANLLRETRKDIIYNINEETFSNIDSYNKTQEKLKGLGEEKRGCQGDLSEKANQLEKQIGDLNSLILEYEKTEKKGELFEEDVDLFNMQNIESFKTGINREELNIDELIKNLETLTEPTKLNLAEVNNSNTQTENKPNSPKEEILFFIQRVFKFVQKTFFPKKFKQKKQERELLHEIKRKISTGIDKYNSLVLECHKGIETLSDINSQLAAVQKENEVYYSKFKTLQEKLEDEKPRINDLITQHKRLNEIKNDISKVLPAEELSQLQKEHKERQENKNPKFLLRKIFRGKDTGSGTTRTVTSNIKYNEEPQGKKTQPETQQKIRFFPLFKNNNIGVDKKMVAPKKTQTNINKEDKPKSKRYFNL